MAMVLVHPFVLNFNHLELELRRHHPESIEEIEFLHLPHRWRFVQLQQQLEAEAVDLP